MWHPISLPSVWIHYVYMSLILTPLCIKKTKVNIVSFGAQREWDHILDFFSENFKRRSGHYGFIIIFLSVTPNMELK